MTLHIYLLCPESIPLPTDQQIVTVVHINPAKFSHSSEPIWASWKLISPCSSTVPTSAVALPPLPLLTSASTSFLLPFSIYQQVHILSALTHILNGVVTACWSAFPKERTQGGGGDSKSVSVALWEHNSCSSKICTTLCAYRNQPGCHCFAMISVTLFGQHRRLFSTHQVSSVDFLQPDTDAI